MNDVDISGILTQTEAARELAALLTAQRGQESTISPRRVSALCQTGRLPWRYATRQEQAALYAAERCGLFPGQTLQVIARADLEALAPQIGPSGRPRSK